MTVITRTHYLELNAVPLATPAWEIPDLSPLLDSPALRGGDRVKPGADGATATRRVRSAYIVTLPLDIFGDLDADGNPYTTPLEGFQEHRDYLETGCGFALTTGDGTVPAVFHRGGLAAVGADVHFLGFKGTTTLSEFVIRTTFDISIPAGRWEEVGS